MVILNISELPYPPITTIAILAVLAVLTGVTLLITGFTVISSVDAQVTGDNGTMSGNMTGGNATEGNMSGSISSFDDGESGGGSVTTNDGGGGCLDC